MKVSGIRELWLAAALVVLLACVPLVLNAYLLSIAVTMMMYVALCTSWALFSGPTHYISLATGAFFGIGGYLVATGMSDFKMSFWLMAAVSPVVATVLAALIGFATLRLSGVYFVIFTLGLAEMIRNLVSWIQNNFLGSRGLYVLTDFDEADIYWMLLVIASAAYLLGWIVTRSRLGFALRIIGNDETVARHVGINTAWSKVVLFMTTGFFAALVGAVIAPRYAYIEPNQVFSPIVLSGRHHGPAGGGRAALGPAGRCDPVHDHLGNRVGPGTELHDAVPGHRLPFDRVCIATWLCRAA